MKFIGTLEVRVEDEGKYRMLLKPLAFDSTTLGRIISVPEGYRTDYASVPRILWNILPPTGRYTKAAVIHDYLYEYGECTREEADAVFLEAMEDLGVSYLVRHSMWLGVRFGGWVGWNKYRKV